ncbi:MAG: NB-ARC domain-containing protein [Candidatus Eremiobacteraeota bacterium]|nr:NB-ARC domain-containing protein [Candidatus Eremiobacteraeota bacterium]
MPHALQVLTFGEFELTGPRGPIETPVSGIARCLFVELARSRRGFSREELAAKWWPDAEPQRARASLSTALWAARSMLRSALGEDPVVASRDHISLDPALEIELDVECFEAAISQGDDAAAERWYGGLYLRGIDEDSVVAERERLSMLYEAAIARLLANDPDPERAHRLVIADPYAEIAYRVLIDTALASGSSSGARAWLRRARSAFEELGSAPQFFLDAPYSKLLELDRDATRRTNLSSEVTSFIGRDEELLTLEHALDDARVVTILGPGGGGKTRLAREIAARRLGSRHTSVWFVELAPIEGPGAVEAAIFSTLGLIEDARPRAEIIRQALVDTDALIVFDNCEHVLDDAAELIARICRDAPLLHIIATSREALRVEAETIVPVGGLRPNDAVALFLARARSADRRLIVDEASTALARQITDALDGLPLAIELAAARVRIDGLATIAQDALQTVRGAVGPRDRERKSQTIAASIAWSVERLDAAARTLYDRLGAFAGDFDARDAAAVDLDGSRALDRIVERSLAARSDHFAGSLRLLSPIRADARRRLESDPSREAVLDAHAEIVRTRAFEWLSISGAAARSAELRLDALGADLEVALERLYKAADPNPAIDLTVKFTRHWATRGSRALAERWLDRASAVVRDDRRRGDIYYALSRFSQDRVETAACVRLGKLALENYERAGDISGQAQSWNVIGCGILRELRFEEAREALERSLALQRIIGDELGVGVALSNLANVAVDAGDFNSAAVAYAECEPIFDRFATIQARIITRNNIAYVRMLLGDRTGSAVATQRALELAEAGGNEALLAFALANAACRAAAMKDDKAALDLVRRVGQLADPPPIYVGYALVARAVVTHRMEDHVAARRFASAARLIEENHGAFEPNEKQLLAPIPGAASEAADTDIASARALARSH